METPSYNQLEEFPVQAADSGGSEWVKKLPMLLRTIGTVAVILSMYSFLVRGWEGSSDLVRYFMLLGTHWIARCHRSGQRALSERRQGSSPAVDARPGLGAG